MFAWFNLTISLLLFIVIFLDVGNLKDACLYSIPLDIWLAAIWLENRLNGGGNVNVNMSGWTPSNGYQTKTSDIDNLRPQKEE